MAAGKEALLRVHAGAFNGHDVESLFGHYALSAKCVRDGRLVGEGPEGLRLALQAEYDAGDEVVGQVLHVDGDPVLVEWSGPEGRRRPIGVLRLQARGDRVTEVRIEHDAETVRRLVERASR